MSIQMKFHKLSENATTPARGSDYAAGLDLFSAEEKIVQPKGRALIKTDIQVGNVPGIFIETNSGGSA